VRRLQNAAGPKLPDCSVFYFYGDVACPPTQKERISDAGGCCGALENGYKLKISSAFAVIASHSPCDFVGSANTARFPPPIASCPQ
jgi:hypothetical protein